MKPVVAKRIRTTEKFSITLPGDELREMISQELAAQGLDRLPPDTYIYVQVPGGGDWSNTDLDLSEYPVEIRWTVESGDDL